MPASARASFVLALALALSSPAVAVASGRPAPPDTARVFQLGAIEVVALRPQGVAALEEQVGGHALREPGRPDYAGALAQVPCLAVSNGGQRNEAGLYLRGFDLRQVSLLVDGIPVYVPYDGYVDLRRFTTFDVSRITVAKGFSSVLYGPNALGGAINVQTQRPAAVLDVSGGAAVSSGAGSESYLSVGSRRERWYVQAAGSCLYQRDFPLSAEYRPVRAQPAGDRLNAKREDWRSSLKLGFTPRVTDEYVLALASQHGAKGNPPYAGSRPGQAVRYWRWPEWDKDDVYLITRTALPWASWLQGRFYYDHFRNELRAYDDSTFTTMLKRSSFKSYYDDPTLGGSLEWALPTGARNTIRASVQAKFDRHQEHDAGTPVKKMDDLSLCYAGEDTWRLAGPLTAVFGASYARRRALTAQDLVAGRTVNLPTGSNSAWNGELALVWDVGRGALRGSVARRTRFATMKDRFSYKMGTAIPNPDLAPESAVHYDVAYTGVPLAGLAMRVAVFHSRIADLIQSVDHAAMVDGAPVSQMRNVGDARIAGFEAGFDATPWRALGVGAAYSYVDRKNLDAPGVRQTGLPRHSVTACVEVSPVRSCSLRVSVSGHGERYATSTGLTLAPFVTVESRGAVEVVPGVSLEAGVANLMDVQYELDEGHPEPGRSGFAGLRFGFTR
jgi:iron complex outermembrane receptor protein